MLRRNPARCLPYMLRTSTPDWCSLSPIRRRNAAAGIRNGRTSWHDALVRPARHCWRAACWRWRRPEWEAQNWLMNHRTYHGQRFAPLGRINQDNVKGLKLAYAVPLGGGAGNEYSVATPLAEDGFLYLTDSWGVLYKIDGTSGDAGRIVWRMDPKQE